MKKTPLFLRNPLKTSSLLYFLCFTGIALLLTCIPYSTPTFLKDETRTTMVRLDWEKFGAYYEIDELFIESSYGSVPLPSGNISSMESNIIISKRLRILTKEGIKYGTIRVIRYYQDIKSFEVKVYNSENVQQPLDLFALQKQFEKDGLIVVPNITAGCVIDIAITFSVNKPVFTFERWFSQNIPVQNSRFTFSRVYNFQYNFKEYGPLGIGISKTAPSNSDLIYTTWIAEDILPRNDLDYQDNYDSAEPRVSIAMKYGLSQPVFVDWSNISVEFRKTLIDESYTILRREASKLKDSLIQKPLSKFAKADLLLSWVQDNISNQETFYNSTNPDRVFKDRQANDWELCVALKELFNTIDLSSDIVVTRPHSQGGFDESFVTPMATDIPLVIVTIDSLQYCAFPYLRGALLGEYPRDYFDLKALSIQKSKVVPLPKSSASSSRSVYDFTIDADKDSVPHTLTINIDGYVAFYYRTLLLSQTQKDINESFQKMLTEYSQSNALSTCSVQQLHDRGKPLHITILFYNTEQVIERKGTKRISLSHVFDDYFSSIDSSRTTPFVYKLPSKVIESVTIKHPKGKKVTATIPADVVKNKLFCMFASQIDKSGTTSFSREISFTPCNLTAGEIKAYIKDITKMNQVKEGYVIIE